MHLTDHVTDVQLNEYIDHESAEREQIKTHLSACDECAARLTALKILFAEIESLPELTLTHNFGARFITTPSLPVPQFPRWLTLTATLQVVVAVIAIVFSAPILSRYLRPYLQAHPIPAWDALVIELQINFMMWLQSIQSIRLPEIPKEIYTLSKVFSTEVLSISVITLVFVWVIGNWWLLRKRSNSLA